MSGHTQGPWQWFNSITDEPYDFSVGFKGEGYPSLRTVQEFGENKTEVRDGKSYTSWKLPKWILDAEPMQNGNDADNAALIAAAPDLLEALEQFVDLGIEEESLKTWPELGKALSSARSAIDKAKGEKQ